jgi:NitT/TauT family transport system substrate-binding protein
MTMGNAFRIRTGRRLAISLAAGLIAATLGGRAVLAESMEHVTLRLDWLPGADHTSIYLAKERGYYAKAGIDLEIHNGTGSVGTIQSVGGGGDMIGLASLSQVALAVGKDVPLIAIAGIVQKAPDSIVALKGSGIVKPKDVEGKRWGFVPTDSGARIFPAFAAANGIDMNKITKIQLSYSTIYTSLLNGDVDFITAWASPDALKIAKKKPIEPPIVFADYGVNTLGTGIFVTRDTFAKHKEMLRKFIAATLHGAEEAQKNPTEAIDAVMKAAPGTDRSILVEEFNHLPEYLHTPNSKGHMFGWMAPADWVQTITLLRKYFALPETIKPTDVYTDELFPKS